MTKITIQDNQLYHGDRLIGPANLIYADPAELPLESIEHAQLPARIDYLFTAGGQVVVGESKSPDDLVSSHHSRRLARQLRTIMGLADLGVLFLRDFSYEAVDLAQEALARRVQRYYPAKLWEDLASVQSSGLYILPLAADPTECVHLLKTYQRSLSRNSRAAFAGSDEGRERERRPGWLLRRVPGWGPQSSAAALDAFGNTWNVIRMAVQGDQRLVDVVGPQRVATLAEAIDT